jgi:hypothetical protein
VSLKNPPIADPVDPTPAIIKSTANMPPIKAHIIRISLTFVISS